MFEDRFNFQSLQSRLLSAAILIPLTLIILYFGGLPFIILLCVLCGVSLFEWSRASFKCDPARQYYYLAFGALYLLGSFYCSYLIFENLGFYWAIVFVFMVWGSDSGAYFAGKIIGGPKMAEMISPNKTWAGFGGALLTPAAIGLVALFLFRGVDGFLLSEALKLILFGAIVGAAGQGGDLLVSALKRQADIKDMGNIIPGHGGILDRLDSMVLAAPIYLFLMMTFYYVG